MKIERMSFNRKWKPVAMTGLLILMSLTMSHCVWMKMLPAPDADKTFLPGNNTCWMATASNMLAGAGYGNGTTVQDRADDIYNDMITQYGTADGGWIDVALSWWLGSGNNTWASNPYTLVTVYGNKTKTPYARTDLPEFMANELRRCQYLGISISWPVHSGGHAITGWGDNVQSGDPLTSNPTMVRVTDSDTDNGGDVQAYSYDTYTSPNPGGSNDGNGWYFNYSTNHPYIKHIVTLCPVDHPSGAAGTVRVLGSYSITNTSDRPATDLHYTVSTDVDILSYKTTNNWNSTLTPTITEGSPRRSIEVVWNFGDKPVPAGTTVVVTTEFILASWNAMSYSDVHFTYPDIGKPFPDIYWKVETPYIDGAEKIKNVTGGYLLGRFELIRVEGPEKYTPVGEYRFYHEYRYNENPEQHRIIFNGPEGYGIRRIGFSHSYSVLPAEEIWRVKEWMTEMQEVMVFTGEPLEVKVDWTGRLPYPEGDGPYELPKPQNKRP